MKILILGHQGMLGHDLMKVFADFNPVGWDIDEIDITNKEEVLKKINDLKPELVINAAAYTNVDQAESHQELAMKVNGQAVGYLAEICGNLGAILVHYSSDYIFSGKKKEGYKEDDVTTGPVNVYGQSKLLGEKNILDFKQQNPDFKFYLIRTSWLFGPSGQVGQFKNFVNTILKLIKERSEIKAVDDQHGKPTYTFDLAKRTREIIEGKKSFGIYHLTNEKACTRYEFAQEIVNLNQAKTKVLPCQTKDFPRPAKRPEYSILINTKLQLTRAWPEALKDYLSP